MPHFDYKISGCCFLLFFLSFTEGRVQTEHICTSWQWGPLFSFCAARAFIVPQEPIRVCSVSCDPANMPPGTTSALPCTVLAALLFFLSPLFAEYSWHKASGFVCVIKKTTHKGNTKQVGKKKKGPTFTFYCRTYPATTEIFLKKQMGHMTSLSTFGSACCLPGPPGPALSLASPVLLPCSHQRAFP